MSRLGDLLQLYPLARFEDATLLVLRALTGSFLVYGTWDNITSAERMDEFAEFLAQFGFASPELLAPLSVWAQFACGLLLILGLLTRWAGIVVCFNFVIAVVMVHWTEDFRGWWPAIVLVALGLHFAARGGGRLAVDALLGDPLKVRA